MQSCWHQASVPLLLTGIVCTFAVNSFAAQEKPVTKARLTGVTIDGKKIDVPPSKEPPWMKDILWKEIPTYPLDDRIRRQEGDGIFRVILDPKKGTVIGVTVVKSTGSKTMDESTVRSFKYWRWKAGKWKEVDVWVKFVLDSGYENSRPSYKPMAR